MLPPDLKVTAATAVSVDLAARAEVVVATAAPATETEPIPKFQPTTNLPRRTLPCL